MTLVAPTTSDEGRASVLAEIVDRLQSRFPWSASSRVASVAAASYDAIVGAGVSIRAYLPNVVEHRARAVLATDPSPDGQGIGPSTLMLRSGGCDPRA